MSKEKEAPLPERLRRVPADYRILISGEGFFPSSTSIPIGVLSHAAAEEIEALRAERDAAREDVGRLREALQAMFDARWCAGSTSECDSLDEYANELARAALAAKEKE